MINFIFLGKPASGKGTQSELLSEKENIPLIATGELFREFIRQKTELGKQVQKYYDDGLLVPTELTMWVIKDKLISLDVSNGIILDGTPRFLSQIPHLEHLFDEFDLTHYIVFDIRISDDTVIHRIINRAKTTNVIRSDDSADMAETRLEIYRKETEPVLQYYRERGLLYEVDGERPIEEVHEDILKIVRKARRESKVNYSN